MSWHVWAVGLCINQRLQAAPAQDSIWLCICEPHLLHPCLQLLREQQSCNCVRQANSASKRQAQQLLGSS